MCNYILFSIENEKAMYSGQFHWISKEAVITVLLEKDVKEQKSDAIW